MTPQEILALIQTHIEGQGNQVDSGSVLPAILRGILEIAQGGENVQSNWAETDNTSPQYIQNKPILDTIVEAITGETLTTEANKYYRADSAVNTLAVTLPAMTEQKVKTVVLGLTTGTTPAITFASADDKVIRMADGFEFEAEKTYEVNALYNGAYWSIAGIVIAPAV